MDACNKRDWFESIRNYLSMKKGAMGVPLSYVIRDKHNVPQEDPGFGSPDFEEELTSKG